MQYKIPQNVRIEDKIVGPLTIKQLISLGIGGGLTYSIYIIMANEFIFIAWFIPVFISGALTLAFTFLKINELSFGKWILLTLEFIKNPKKRIFIMGSADFHTDLFKTPENKELVKSQATSDRVEKDKEKIKKIAEITKNLDTYGKLN